MGYSYLDDDEEEQNKPTGFNPDVLNFMQNKYSDQLQPQQMGPPSDLQAPPPLSFQQKRDQAVQDLKERNNSANWASVFSNLGDVIAGKQVGSGNQVFDKIKEQNKAETVGKVDKQRKDEAFRASVGKMFPGVYTPEQLAGLGAEDLDTVLKPQEQLAKINANKETHAATVEMQRERYANQADARKSAAELKIKSAQDDAYQKASHDRMTFRGNMAAQQANQALTKAENAISTVDPKTGVIDITRVHAFATELANMQIGGVPGAAEIEANMPSSVRIGLSKVISGINNAPSPAEAQEFLKNNMPLVMDLMKNYGDVVDSFKDNAVEGWKKKLNPSDFAELKSKNEKESYKTRHGDYFGNKKSGFVQMKDPQGNIRNVPADQVESAKAAGGVEL